MHPKSAGGCGISFASEGIDPQKLAKTYQIVRALGAALKNKTSSRPASGTRQTRGWFERKEHVEHG